MECYTIPQRAKIVQLFWEKSRSIINTQRAYRTFYGVRNVPTAPTIRAIVAKFERYGNVRDARRTGRPRSGRSVENIQLVRQSVTASPETSTRRRSTQLGIPRGTVIQILKKDLRLYPYKIQMVQQLNPGDLAKRLEYSRTLLNIAENDELFLENLMMTDEAHFHLSGFVNKKKLQILGHTESQKSPSTSLTLTSCYCLVWHNLAQNLWTVFLRK